MNKSKVISIRMTEEEYILLNYYRELTTSGAMKPQDFIREAISEKIDKIRLERAGHTHLLIKNPMSVYAQQEVYDKSLEALTECLDTLTKNNPKIDYNILEIFQFAKKRILEDGKDGLLLFQKQIEKDIDFEENLKKIMELNSDLQVETICEWEENKD